MSDGALSEDDFRELGRILESRHGKLKVIPVKGNDKAVIVRTSNEAVPAMRKASGRLELRGKRLTATLTSGAIGKLKRAAGPASPR